MIEIPLSQGKVAFIDDCDEAMVKEFRWLATARVNDDWYACRHPKKSNGRYTTLYLHQFILNAEGRRIDHRNHNGLDCQRHNMRFCTHADNMRNRIKRNQKTTSRFKGVSLSASGKTWVSQIMKNRKLIRLGRFKTEIEAAAVYNTAAKSLFGEFAFLNSV